MISYDGKLGRCDHPACEASVQNNGWAMIRAGWFEQRVGVLFCPEHVPEWVAEWRLKKKGEKRASS